jgi:hypothetical protein
MAMQITEGRRRQRRLTYWAIAVTVGLHALLLLWRAQVYSPPDPPPSIGEIPTAAPPPELPPEVFVRPEGTKPPPMPPGFTPPPLPTTDDVDASDFAPVIYIDMPKDDNSTVELAKRASIVPPEIEFRQRTRVVDDFVGKLFEPLSPAGLGSKVALHGAGNRISGHTAIAVLDLPGTNEEYPWSGGELELIADFVSRNTNLRLELSSRAISFVGSMGSFEAWLRDAGGRGFSSRQTISKKEPEIDALDVLADAVPYAMEGGYERFRQRVRHLASDYLHAKFNARFDPLEENWVEALDKKMSLRQCEKEYLADGQEALRSIWHSRNPKPERARGLYLMLRTFELLRLPVLLCEPRGVPARLHPEAIRMLRTYVENGGFIYFANTANINRARAIRGLITAIVDDDLRDAEGEATLARMMEHDREVTGYEFRDPEPRIAHPWTFFPMILPRTTDVTLSIYNRHGVLVYRDERKRIPPGAYLQKYRHYRWNAVDNEGRLLESGYYIYRIEADLCRKTGAVGISKLRLLPSGKHDIYSARYNISEVPSTVSAKARDLAYGERGVFGVSLGGRLAICYAEGYGEKSALVLGDALAREASLKWMTNVVMHALAERSLSRP